MVVLPLPTADSAGPAGQPSLGQQWRSSELQVPHLAICVQVKCEEREPATEKSSGQRLQQSSACEA